ncbi:MAG: glucosidase [Thermodesulfobacteriota bacterium]|nr:MAG: glucosidase [Thermodesulfobacteriota bacterium]
MTKEEKRLKEDREKKSYWRRWGPYLSERQWGTVREDYSSYGTAWEYLSHEDSRSRAYRWGEDGIAGISDNHQRLCFAISLWNGQDPIIKERLFGLTGNEGNHGEDVKEYYYYLDNTPSHSYMKYLYKYPQGEFPYTKLVEENKQRGRLEPEYELIDTGIFEDNRYYDVFVEYAKKSSKDILIRINIVNRADDECQLHVLPTLWFKNDWSWFPNKTKPSIKLSKENNDIFTIQTKHPELEDMWFYCESPTELLFTENETNMNKLFGTKNSSAYVKDGINEYIVNGLKERVNPEPKGTKFCPCYLIHLNSGESRELKFRLSKSKNLKTPFGKQFDETFLSRKNEADEFYEKLCNFPIDEDIRNIQRQSFSGMLWAKQFYNYVVEEWLEGDPAFPPPPEERKNGRNHNWTHLHADDVLSMPDKWEYPWFAAWDTAFHTIPLSMVDPDFAKRQLTRLTREWYMHPNGQIPAYEWAFGDVNPPVHAWGAWRVYKIERKIYGVSDKLFLESVFQKLLLNFTWWVNRKDTKGNNIFQGGFLGLDNVGVFDRSAALPSGGYMEQADGTSWMGMYALNMLTMALELAKDNKSYEDIASKFFEHFLYISDAINHLGESGTGLWDENDGFYYDILNLPNGQQIPLKIRSMVGLIPIFAVMTIEQEVLDSLPGFKRRMEWFTNNRHDLVTQCAIGKGDIHERRFLSITNQFKLRRILEKMLDEEEFLSPYGVRSLSKYHQKNPYILKLNGTEYRVDYEPAESTTGLFGGNSNWRGPVWFPVNFLIIESLQKFHHFLGDSFKVECPTGSGNLLNLWEVSLELSHRLMKIFTKDGNGRRPFYGGVEKFQTDPHWKDLITFNEYFHGDNGAGIGASHQTGWTGLIAKLIKQCAEYDDH